jgi:3-methyl-2-oxobutanoate hydroxymethyltransferase
MSKTARFFDMKRRGEKIAMLTCYDYPTAKAQAEAGIDVIFVGDSVGTNVLGYQSEKDVTLADIVHHLRAVRRGAPGDNFVMADLPYGTYETPDMAVANAKVLAAAGADMVKFEGSRPDIVAAVVGAGIDVCCHIGLEPQHHDEKRVKGRTADAARRLVADAIALDEAGMSMVVLELVPEEVAAEVTKAVAAPTIGIGAGRMTDGQVLVVCDLLGFTEANFKHNRRYREVGRAMREAASLYKQDVRSQSFPADTNVFHMPKAELEALLVKAV